MELIMTRLEIANVLNDIMIENNFSIIDRDNCHDKYSEKINSMQEIFHLKKSSDFTYLYAVAHLLSDKEKSVDDYLISENKDSIFAKDVKLPTRDDLLLVATAFEENPEFFSMAWNWVVITEDRLSQSASLYMNNENIIYINLRNYQNVVLNQSILVPAAGTKKTNNITTLTIDPIGELQILGNDYLGFITFAIFLKPEYQKIKFKVIIKYEIDNKEYLTEIKKDNISEQKTVSPEKPEYVDFSKGVKIKSIEWSPLE